MEDIKINYEEIFNIIKNNFLSVMKDNEAYYDGYKVIMGVEQQFIKQKDMEPGAIYIVVKYGQASVEFGQSVLPVTITAISEENKIDVCQHLFIDMAEKYTTSKASDDTIQQLYELPVVTSNFNNFLEGYRSILYSTATFVITKNVNYYTFYYYPDYENNPEEMEEIKCLHSIFGGDTQLDSDIFFNSDNFTRSEAKFGTNTLNITTYVLNNLECVKKALYIYLKRRDLVLKGINETFKIGIKFKYIDEIFIDDYKLSNVNIQQQLSEIPLISMTFTN